MSFAALPSLNALRVFEAAARHGSFVRAADELCVTHGAVSRQIAALQAEGLVEHAQDLVGDVHEGDRVG